MFEQYIERTVQLLWDSLGNERRYVYLKEILDNADVPLAYKSFFAAEAAWWVYEEESALRNHPNFDLCTSELEPLMEQYFAALYNNARFDLPTLKAMVESAVNSRFNYVCRPRTTLKWFVFRGEPTRSLREIILRQNYLFDYPYLKDSLNKWLKSIGSDHSGSNIVSLIEYMHAVEDLDNENIFDFSLNQFIELLSSLFAVFNPDAEVIDDKSEIPIEAFLIFLDDKGIIRIPEKLDLLRKNGVKNLVKKQIVGIISEVLEESDGVADVSNQSDVFIDVAPEELDFELGKEIQVTQDIMAIDEIAERFRNSNELKISNDLNLSDKAAINSDIDMINDINFINDNIDNAFSQIELNSLTSTLDEISHELPNLANISDMSFIDEIIMDDNETDEIFSDQKNTDQTRMDPIKIDQIEINDITIDVGAENIHIDSNEEFEIEINEEVNYNDEIDYKEVIDNLGDIAEIAESTKVDSQSFVEEGEVQDSDNDLEFDGVAFEFGNQSSDATAEGIAENAVDTAEVKSIKIDKQYYFDSVSAIRELMSVDETIVLETKRENILNINDFRNFRNGIDLIFSDGKLSSEMITRQFRKEIVSN